MSANAVIAEAFAHHRAGRLAEAEALYRQVLALEADNLNALQLLGALAQDSGRASEAVALLERATGALQRRGNEAAQHAPLYNNLGNALRSAGRGAAAVASFRHGIALDPAIPELHAGLAAALRQENDLAGAAEAWEAALRLNPERPDWLLALAAVCATLGTLDEAVARYHAALALDPGRAEALRGLALALLALGRAAEAVAPLQRLAAAEPDNAAILSELGAAQYAAKEWDAAAANFARVLALRRDDAEAHWMIGAIRHAQGRFDDAETAYRAALALKSNLPGALFNLAALLYRERENPAEAAALLERLTAQAPNHAEAHCALGNARRSLKRIEPAIAAYRRYAELAPQAALAHHLLGQSLSEAGKKEEAIAPLARAAALAAGEEAALAEVDLGNVLLDLGREEEGQRHFRAALALAPVLTRKAGKRAPDFVALFVFAPGAYNTPYEYLIDRADFDAHVLLLLPGYGYDVHALAARAQVAMNLVSDPERDKAMLPEAAALLDRLGLPVINHPARIRPTDRAAIAALLKNIPGCRVPRVERASGAALLEPGFRAPPTPFLARLAGRHGGEEFELIERAEALAPFAARHADADFYLIEYLDYRSADGFFRKYRFFFVGEEILPYHLAIGNHWKLHHITTDMGRHPWMQREEEAFLSAPERVFAPQNYAALRAIRAAVGLDYFGIDCGLDRDGNLVLFETNASMLAHGDNLDFPYKTPHVRRIKAAFAAMLGAAASRSLKQAAAD